MIDDMEVLRYLAVRDAYPEKALKHTRVIAVSGMTIEAVELLRESLRKQTRSDHPIDLIVYSDFEYVHMVDTSLAIPLISLTEFIHPSRIVFGEGMLKCD